MTGLLGLLLLVAMSTSAHAQFSISGQVYLDADVSLSFTGGDSGIDGVTVVLYDVSGSSCLSVATSGGGLYSFAGLAAGDYRIYEAAGETVGALTACPPTESTADPVSRTVTSGTIQDPPDYISTTPNRIDLTLAADILGQDFGDYLLGPSFPCDDTAWLLQQNPSEVWEIDLTTGTPTGPLATLSTGLTNAFGFDVLNGYLWGANLDPASVNSQANGITVVSSDSNSVLLPYLNDGGDPTSMVFNAGDVTLDGYLVQSHGKIPPPTLFGYEKLCWVDVNPQRTTYLSRIDPATGLADTGCVSISPQTGADLAMHPQDGLLYSVQSHESALQDLIITDPVTGSTTEVLDVLPRCPLPSNAYGAQYFDVEGFLYASCNSNGDIYRIDLTTPGVVGDVVLFSNGPTTVQNDGGRCALASQATDFGDAPDTYGTTIASDGPRHRVVPDLLLGALIDNESDGQPDAGAAGDDLDAVDDADGLVGNFAWSTMADSLSVTVSVVNTTGSTAYVGCYVDFDEDGTFNTTDEYTESSTATSGNPTMTWTTPAGQANNPPFARCRISTDQVAIQTPTGAAVDGEVEDHALSFPAMPTCSDGILNLDETAIDCGGSCPNVCLTFGMHPDVSRMKFGRGASGLDYLLVQGGLSPIAWDPVTCAFDLAISNANGPVVSFSAPAGSTTPRKRCSIFKDKAARKSGGLQRLQVCSMLDPSKVRFNLKGFEDYDAAATLADMTIEVTACGSTYSRHTTWRQLKRGWLLPRAVWGP